MSGHTAVTRGPFALSPGRRSRRPRRGRCCTRRGPSCSRSGPPTPRPSGSWRPWGQSWPTPSAPRDRPTRMPRVRVEMEMRPSTSADKKHLLVDLGGVLQCENALWIPWFPSPYADLQTPPATYHPAQTCEVEATQINFPYFFLRQNCRSASPPAPSAARSVLTGSPPTPARRCHGRCTSHWWPTASVRRRPWRRCSKPTATRPAAWRRQSRSAPGWWWRSGCHFYRREPIPLGGGRPVRALFQPTAFFQPPPPHRQSFNYFPTARRAARR